MKLFRMIKPAVCLLLALALTGCAAAASESTASAAVPVQADYPQRGELVLQGEYIASLSVEGSAYVIPLVSGEVLELRAAVGDTIAAGELLARLDDAPAQLQLKNAQAAYETVKAGAGVSDTQTQSGLDQLDDAKDTYEDLYESLEKQAKAAKSAADAMKPAVAAAEQTYIEAKEKYAAALANNAKDDADSIVSEAALANMKYEMEQAQADYDEIKAQYDKADNGASSLSASAQQYKANYETYKDQYSAAKDTGESSEDVTKAQLAQAQAGIDAAQYQLKMYRLTAPVSGRVESVQLSEHGFASAGSPAFVISGEGGMEAVFYVSEGVRNTLAVGQALTAERLGGSYFGKITTVGAMADAARGLFEVKASIECEQGALLPGTTAKLTMDTYRSGEALLIPYDAVYYDGGAAYVYCVEDGYARRTPVETILFDDTTMAVSSGLNEGSLVVTSWSPRLADGVQVDVQ